MRAPTFRILVVLFLCLFPTVGFAQDLTIPLGDEGSLAGRSIQLIVLITVLSIVPGLAMMITCFPFIVTVLSILRQAIGLQQSPPNMLIVSLALFLTYFVMEPVFMDAWTGGLSPLLNEQIDLRPALERMLDPFQSFMSARTEPETLIRFQDLRAESTGARPEDDNLSVLVPSFLLSEISRAFEIGFLIYLPFLIIDLVVAAVLMSMGMMMVPPAVVSMPFKLAFFVVVDGWALISEALVRGYGV
ncbi:flagellar type III secretion system pore protein FliP [Rhodovulum sp. FJ3]|uniref:flagellar type III secretion system pore protein FliP n=1 Tax=Rhodovulum sp. FJ3 TaxID=3079053 RepID=UPI00293DB075|nr:flagellar type III secretion system pore protein FliP [Rhodovulum sp. FJ3]MDV4169809.1 flagellar type III secretion system pore protein FliP [Rhodovulum sp. FJ3]